MRKTLLLIISVLFLFVSCEDKEDTIVPTIFVKTFGSGGDSGNSVQQTNDGGYIITGKKRLQNGSDVWLIKTDSQGQGEWSNVFDGGTGAGGESVQQTTDGGYIIVGDDLIKTDSQGNQEWINENIGGRSVQQTTDGGYIVTGSNNSDFNLIKVKSNGNEEWNKNFNGGGMEEGFYGLQTNNGGYIIVGGTQSVWNQPRDFLLIKIDSNGDEEWNQIFDGGGDDEGHCIQQTTDGGYIITGVKDLGTNQGNIWLIKIDSNGDEEWNQTFGAFNNEFYGANYVQQTTDGGYIITGTMFSAETDDFELGLIKTNSYGFKEWIKTFALGGFGSGKSVQQTTDGGYIVTGSFGEMVVLIKTDSQGNTTPESEWE